MNHWQLSEIRDCITAIVTLINLPLIMLVKPRSHNLVVRREAFFFVKKKPSGKKKQGVKPSGKRKQKESLQGSFLLGKETFRKEKTESGKLSGKRN